MFHYVLIGLNKDYCAWTHAGGAGVSACPPPGRTKTFFFHCTRGPFCYFFSMGEALCYVSLLMQGFYHCIEAFLLVFLYVGAFLLRLSPGVELFSQCGSLFGNFFLDVGRLFCLHGGFYVFIFFYGLAPSPYHYFCERMLLCNFDPMSSAITYSGHYVPNKAHCNTRVQLTITMK